MNTKEACKCNTFFMLSPLDPCTDLVLLSFSGDLVLRSKMTTSKWGDQHLFFRHQEIKIDNLHHLQAFLPKL